MPRQCKIVNQSNSYYKGKITFTLRKSAPYLQPSEYGTLWVCCWGTILAAFRVRDTMGVLLGHHTCSLQSTGHYGCVAGAPYLQPSEYGTLWVCCWGDVRPHWSIVCRGFTATQPRAYQQTTLEVTYKQTSCRFPLEQLVHRETSICGRTELKHEMASHTEGWIKGGLDVRETCVTKGTHVTTVI